MNIDWIVDLGSGSGKGGDEVVAHGTPEMIKKAKGSYTGEYLRKSQN